MGIIASCIAILEDVGGNVTKGGLTILSTMGLLFVVVSKLLILELMVKGMVEED